MPGLEKELKREIRITQTRKAILSTIGLAGVIAIGIALPNTVQLLGRPLTKSSRRNTYTAIQALIKKGLVHKDAHGRLSLTKRGEKVLHTLELRHLFVERPKRWDRKWRIVTFDIAESRKHLRKELVAALRSIGFIRLQDSVWIFPYDCEELVALLRTRYTLGKEVLYMIVDKIENERPLRAAFDLD